MKTKASAKKKPVAKKSVSRTPVSKSSSGMYPVLCHASALAGFVMPFGNIVGPLIVWLLTKDRTPEVDVHGKEAMNFQISMTIYTLVAGMLVLVLIGIPFLIVLTVLDVLFTIRAIMAANNGEVYRYPLSMRLIK